MMNFQKVQSNLLTLPSRTSAETFSASTFPDVMAPLERWTISHSKPKKENPWWTRLLAKKERILLPLAYLAIVFLWWWSGQAVSAYLQISEYPITFWIGWTVGFGWVVSMIYFVTLAIFQYRKSQ